MKTKKIKLLFEVELTVTTDENTNPSKIVHEINENLSSSDLISKHGVIKKGSVKSFIRTIENGGKETGWIFENDKSSKK